MQARLRPNAQPKRFVLGPATSLRGRTKAVRPNNVRWLAGGRLDGQSKYSDLAIETALRLRLLFQLRLAEARRVENTFMRYKGFRGDR